MDRLTAAAGTAPADVEALRAGLVGWGLPRLRDLPWRRTRDPWAILVSEVMLQQTQAARVVPSFAAFVDAFPTPARCAAAPLADVLRLWQGLGYPRRARDLHTTSAIVATAGFPRSVAGLTALPGIGPYTARAVMAFAFELDVAVVDTNIARVLARLAGRRLTLREAQALADSLLTPGDSWTWNQTIMDLGAVVCRPVAPGCAACPLASHCAYRGSGADPAPGSAAVSRRQAPYAGSDREARGQLLRAASAGVLTLADAARACGGDRGVALRLVDGLVAEGLLVRDGDAVRLPG